MIDISDLTHRISGTAILSNITASLPKGRLTALIGPNGAGKSTLLRLIGRLDPLQEGRIIVNGLDIRQTPSQDLARVMAIMGQQNTIASRLRLAELVGFGRWPHHHGRPTQKDRMIADQALADFNLTDLAHRFLDEVSGGQAQRACLAMAFAQQTDWLLLDEPLNNLDMAHGRALMARLAALVREGGKSVVVVLHDINYAAAWADHILALKDGKVMAAGAPADVLTGPMLEQIYDTPVQVITHQGRPLILHHL